MNVFLYYYIFENENVLIEYFYYFPPFPLISFVTGVSGGFIFLDKIDYLKKKKIYL